VCEIPENFTDIDMKHGNVEKWSNGDMDMKTLHGDMDMEINHKES
jgi:hypothetical protein